MYTRTRRRRHANENNDPNNHDDKIYKCLFTRETALTLPKKQKRKRKRAVRYRCLVVLIRLFSTHYLCLGGGTSIRDLSARLISNGYGKTKSIVNHVSIQSAVLSDSNAKSHTTLRSKCRTNDHHK